MAGMIKKMIDEILEQRSKGSTLLKMTLRTKFVLKGINPDQYTETSPDDPQVIASLKAIAKQLNA